MFPVYILEDEGSWLLHSEHATYEEAAEMANNLRHNGQVARAPRGEERP